MDYSFRSVANEMVRLNVCKHLILSSLALIYSCLLCVVFYQVYVPLDFESRYVVSHYTDTLQFWYSSVIHLVPSGINHVDECFLVVKRLGPKSSRNTGYGE